MAVLDVKILATNAKLGISYILGLANSVIMCVQPVKTTQIIVLPAYLGLILWIKLVNSLAKNIV